MKNVKIVVHYLLICALALFGLYIFFVAIATFTMFDLRYISIGEWDGVFRLFYALISLWIIYCSVCYAKQDWVRK